MSQLNAPIVSAKSIQRVRVFSSKYFPQSAPFVCVPGKSDLPGAESWRPLLNSYEKVDVVVALGAPLPRRAEPISRQIELISQPPRCITMTSPIVVYMIGGTHQVLCCLPSDTKKESAFPVRHFREKRRRHYSFFVSLWVGVGSLL